jgi:hypothetical protein
MGPMCFLEASITNYQQPGIIQKSKDFKHKFNESVKSGNHGKDAFADCAWLDKYF